jgi:flagellar biosynthesis protein FlhA
LQTNLPELLSYAGVEKLLEDLPETQSRLVAATLAVAPMIRIRQVLQSLLAERVSIRDLPTILASICEATGDQESLEETVERVRQALGRQLWRAARASDGKVPALVLSQKWEAAIANALVGEGRAKRPALTPELQAELSAEFIKAFETAALRGDLPVLVTSPSNRRFVLPLVRDAGRRTAVFGSSEIPKSVLRLIGEV